jgi:phospholipid/cholesterol/gamma-HCH transport system permease protein
MPLASATVRIADDQLITNLAGDWRLELGTPQFAPLITAALAADATPPTAARTLAFDSSALGAWDSSLLIFVQQAQAFGAARDLAVSTAGLPTQVRQMIALADAVPERKLAPPPPAPSRTAQIGLAGSAAYDFSVAAVTFLGEIAAATTRLVTRRVPMQWRQFWVVVQSNSSGALPIVTLIALLGGVIIAFLGVVVLERFGAGYYVSYLVGYGMLREMGALMTGIIIAGRTGAGFAAELGSMKITEELDAYTTLGVSSVDYLVMPRVLGL